MYWLLEHSQYWPWSRVLLAFGHINTIKPFFLDPLWWNSPFIKTTLNHLTKIKSMSSLYYEVSSNITWNLTQQLYTSFKIFALPNSLMLMMPTCAIDSKLVMMHWTNITNIRYHKWPMHFHLKKNPLRYQNISLLVRMKNHTLSSSMIVWSLFHIWIVNNGRQSHIMTH